MRFSNRCALLALPLALCAAGTWLLDKAKALHVESQAPLPIVMGRHLLALGIQPGPDMGTLLDECYEAQLDGLFTTLDDGLTYLRNLLPPVR